MGVPFSFLGAFGIGKETVAGTGVAPTVFLPIRDESLKGENNLIMRQGIRHTYGRPSPIDGRFVCGGDFTFEADSMCMGLPLKLAMGAVSKSTLGGGAYKHTFTLGYPREYFTAEVNRITEINSGKPSIWYSGGKIDSMKWAIANNELLLCTMGCAFMDEASHAETTPSYSTQSPFVFTQIAVGGILIGGVANAYIENFEVTLNNNLYRDHYTLGSKRRVRSLPEQQASVTGTMTLSFESGAEQRRFWGDVASATTPATNSTGSTSIDITMEGDQIGSSGFYHTARFLLGYVKYKSVPSNLRSGERIMQTVEYEAFETADGAADDIKMELTNSDSADY